jgi:hypothetical protein
MTIKVAEKFFSTNKFSLTSGDSFESTDLYIYLEMISGSKPVIDNTKGIIKVIKESEKDTLHFYENIFYDFDEGLGETAYYINIPGINIDSAKITNNPLGYKLATEGFAVVDVPDEYQKLILGNYPKMPFKKTPIEEGMGEPYATHKFSDSIWELDWPETKERYQNMVYFGVKDLLKGYLNFGGVLEGLDAYDLNLLQWKEGRSMEAHNGIDYRSFINLITYNTEHCSQTRDIAVGEYDWYNIVFESLKTGNYEPLMDIQKGKREFDKVTVQTSKAVLVNAFNPRFYHQVGKMEGEGSLYVCTSNMSFRSIVEKFDFKW